MASAQSLAVKVSNGIPKKILDKCFLNKDRDFVEFKLLGVNEKSKRYMTKNVPGSDYLYDPETGKTYPITFLGSTMQGLNGETIETAQPIWFESKRYSRVICNLNTSIGRRLYEYLCLSNYNKSNPYRDKTVQPIYFMVDNKAAAQKALDVDRQIIKVKEMVHNLSSDQLRSLADYYYLDSRDPIVVLRHKMLNRADKDAINMEVVVEEVKKDGDFFSAVVRAKRHNIIRINHQMGRWIWNDTNQMIVGYNSEVSSEQNDRRLALFLKNDEGAKVYETILKKLEDVRHQYNA